MGDDNSGQTEFLNVRETARRLGVHENTVRNWVREGILRTARVPGSKFHRFDARDVERLRRRRGSSVASVEAERSRIGPELVDATQLSHWAATRDAQGAFPELLARLLAGTPGVTNISVRTAEGVALPGWDGFAESTGASFLPSGALCFELGVGAQPKAKADADYAKRTRDPAGVDPSECVFVFVTPRRWSGAGKWASEKRADGTFKDVRVLDADDLEGWLRTAPAVHYWISERLGRRPRDAETLEHWWARFQARTDPALPPALFLAGREREAEQLVSHFEGPPAVITIEAIWRDEAIAFIQATSELMRDDGSSGVQPSLIVATADVWDRVVNEPGRMTLIPTFENADLSRAGERDHHVVLPVGRDQAVRGQYIKLPRPGRQAAGDALRGVGIEADRAYTLSALARRSMPALLRRLARDPRASRPIWSEMPDGQMLAPLVLIGAWGLSETDTATIARIVGTVWETIEATLLRWTATDDPPFVRTGQQWYVASAEEAFLMLRHMLTAAALERWRNEAVITLLELDPRLTLDPETRLLAGFSGISRERSSVLRRGVADGAILLAALDDEPLADGTRGSDLASSIVREVLDRANGDSSGRTWHSLADVLPSLAEAAPEAFLDAVQSDLDREEPLLATMFQDSDHKTWLSSSSPHTGLLWALERLCWSGDYLLDATRALVRLEIVDPGGRLSNRPRGSLHTVLVGWIRHTAAALALKVQAIEQICLQEPDIGWNLLLALFPSQHLAISPPVTPRYRDWLPENRTVTVAEWVEYIGHLVGFALQLADADVDRWATLAAAVGTLPPADSDRVLAALEGFADPALLDDEQRVILWERLHTEVNHHRRFSSATWAMRDELLVRLQAIADRIEPLTNVERFGYLFDWHPDLPEVDMGDFDTYQARLRELRAEAATLTLNASGIQGVRELAGRSPVASQLGFTVGEVASDSVTGELLTWLDSNEPNLAEVARAWAARKLDGDDAGSRLREMLSRPEMTIPERRVALVLQAPSSSDVWDVLAALDRDLSDSYWRGMQVWRLRHTDVPRVVRELLSHDRPWVALDALVADLHRPESPPTAITPELARQVLDSAMTADPRSARSQSLGYGVGLVLDYLEARGAPAEVLARYEFVFFRLLDNHRPPRALFAALRNDPHEFVSLVQRVFRGKDEPDRDLNEADTALAHHAWWILNHWDDLPGLNEDGSIDPSHLTQWVQTARLALAESDRADIGDEQIGQVLAASPTGTDGIWPAEPVRDIIEAIGSTSLESGLNVGRYNARGPTSRGIFDGGQQERELAQQYREWSKLTGGRWPRTARVLRMLAETYERDAARADTEAQVRADTQ